MEAEQAYFIFYVADQRKSAGDYRAILQAEPVLDVPGITEFLVRDGTLLCLLPIEGAKRLLGAERFSGAPAGEGTVAASRPTAEVYLLVDDPEGFHQRALDRGFVELSSMQARDWGHRAAYSMDPDSNVVAFAAKI